MGINTPDEIMADQAEPRRSEDDESDSVNAALAENRQRMEGWSGERARLLERVVNADYDELRRLHDDFNRIEMECFLLTFSVTALHRNCTRYRDVIATRVLALVAAEMAASGRLAVDISFALISMGSDGREEQTLITDQDYLIVYGDGGGATADGYFSEFSSQLVDRLEEVGFNKCTGDIMPINPTWRGSISQWRTRVLSIVRYEFDDYAKNLMNLIVLSDARYVAGDKYLADKLTNLIREMEQDYSRVLWGMAKNAAEMKLALGFLNRVWTESSGEHRGEFNLKLLAWAPLVMNIRILALSREIPATGTMVRIRLLEKKGSLSAKFSAELQDAYRILTKHRILLQIRVIKGIQNDSHYINPYQLPTKEREQIRHAIIKIEELQKIIQYKFSIC